MKTCKDCQIIKPYGEFVAKASCRDGYEPRCRSCRTIKYNKGTPDLVFKTIYRSQVANSIVRGHPAPAYTLDQLKIWVDQQPHAQQLWDEYVASGYLNTRKPSIDRIIDSLPYQLDNLELMTWERNRKKAHASRMLGLLRGGPGGQRRVSAIHPDGSLYKTYHSIMAAARDVDGHMSGISSVANGKPIKHSQGSYYQPKSYKGFKWKWA